MGELERQRKTIEGLERMIVTMTQENRELMKALQAYEEAQSDLFGQCCSNPVFNAWGKQVDMTKLNHAHMIGSRLVKPRTEPCEDRLRRKFESMNRDSYGFRRSTRGTYTNPAIARDWKWFQLGYKEAS